MTPRDADVAVSRPRGRPQRFPFDALATTDPAIDPTMRMAWLLTTSRVLSPATRSIGRDEFVERMRERGLALDTFRVSRWETGALVPRDDVLDAYESVVGLPEGALRSVRAVLHPTPLLTEDAALSVADAGTALDDCFAALRKRGATGADWLRLSRSLTSFERVYLEPSTWKRLSNRLIAELARSSGLAYVRRHVAAVTLLAHPSAGRHLSLGVGRFVMNPDVQTVTPALSLLRGVDDAAVGSLVLKLINGDNPMLRRGALGVAPAMAARGHLPDDIDALLERHAGLTLGRGGVADGRTDALDLVMQLSEPAYQRVVASVGDEQVRRRVVLARTAHELVATDVARSTADSVAAAVEQAIGRAGHDPDQMLRKLLREALFHARGDRRHLAAIVLAASPYAQHVATTLLELTTRDDLAAATAWSALRRFGHVLSRDQVAQVALLENRPALQSRAWLTLGLAHNHLHDDVAAQLAHTAGADGASPEQPHAALYALGMAGHAELRTMADHVRPEVGRGARWWLDVGSSLHDELT